MSEITKLYENAGIKTCKRKQGFTLKDCTDRDCKECGYYIIPPFTAEKQLELIKWLINKGQLRITRFLDEYSFDFRDYDLHTCPYYVNEMLPSIKEGISFIINNIWQVLSEVEQQQVKGILE